MHDPTSSLPVLGQPYVDHLVQQGAFDFFREPPVIREREHDLPPPLGLPVLPRHRVHPMAPPDRDPREISPPPLTVEEIIEPL
jgi:hypothetical protein